MGLASYSLIPRKQFQAWRVTQTLDERNKLTETKEPFTITNAGLYPIKSYQMWTLPEGIRSKRCWRMITTTELIPQLQEADGEPLRDVVLIDGEYFFVFKVEEHNMNVLGSYDCVLVKHDEVHGPVFKED